MAEKREEMSRFPPIWKPVNEKEELVGVILRKQESEKYGFSLVLQGADGKEVTTPSHKNLQGTLKDNLESGKLQIGDKVAITFIAMKQVKKKGGGMTDPFHDYKVEKVTAG